MDFGGRATTPLLRKLLKFCVSAAAGCRRLPFRLCHASEVARPGYRPMRACICSSLSLYMGLTPFSSFQKFGKPEKSLLRAGLSALERRLSFVFPFDIYSIPFQL